jgi:hypothetical protein
VLFFGGGFGEGGVGPIGFSDWVLELPDRGRERCERVLDVWVREAACGWGVVFDGVFADLLESGFAGGREGGDLVCD